MGRKNNDNKTKKPPKIQSFPLGSSYKIDSCSCHCTRREHRSLHGDAVGQLGFRNSSCTRSGLPWLVPLLAEYSVRAKPVWLHTALLGAAPHLWLPFLAQFHPISSCSPPAEASHESSWAGGGEEQQRSPGASSVPSAHAWNGSMWK